MNVHTLTKVLKEVILKGLANNYIDY